MKTILFATLLAALPLSAQSGDAAWKKFDFMLGKWVGAAGEKETPHGAGQGGFSFEPELNQKIIVRRNHAEYTSEVKHDDLMIIYLDAPDTPRAIYFDTEGHVIRYNVTFPEASKAIFESEASLPGPRYRLTYWMNGPSMDGKFEIAPPNAEYKTYMSWSSKKVDH
jgi:hypothetical protein